MDSSGSGLRPVTGPCKHRNDPSDCLKVWEVTEQLRNYKLLKKDSVLCS